MVFKVLVVGATNYFLQMLEDGKLIYVLLYP
jgi:hypothetical protein